MSLIFLGEALLVIQMQKGVGAHSIIAISRESTLRIFRASAPADMWWSFDRLSAMSGHLFVFRKAAER